jgi:hypothetical protein
LIEPPLKDLTLQQAAEWMIRALHVQPKGSRQENNKEAPIEAYMERFNNCGRDLAIKSGFGL